MEQFKATPLNERKSQNLTFWDYTKERLFWGALPLITGGAAMLFGRLTNWEVPILNGSADVITSLWAKGVRHFTKDETAVKWIKEGGIAGDVINALGGEKKETLRKYYFNFAKGSEVAIPFSAYFLWHKKEENRLDLQSVAGRLEKLNDLKPTDAELAEQNAVMRKELAFFGGEAPLPTASKASITHHGTLASRVHEVA